MKTIFGDNKLINNDHPDSFDDFGFQTNSSAKNSFIKMTETGSGHERQFLADRIQKKLNIANEGYRYSIELFEFEKKKMDNIAKNQVRSKNLKLGENIRKNTGLYSTLDFANRIVMSNDDKETEDKGVLTPHKLTTLDFSQKEMQVPNEKEKMKMAKVGVSNPKDQRKLMLLQHKEIINNEQMKNAQIMAYTQNKNSSGGHSLNTLQAS